MATWVKISQTVTATGEPNQFFCADPEDQDEVFMVAVLRITGGDDDAMPRRIVGLGDTREAAARSLEDTFGRYDPSYRLVASR